MWTLHWSFLFIRNLYMIQVPNALKTIIYICLMQHYANSVLDRVGNHSSFSSKLLIFLWAQERVALVALLSWASWANCSRSLFCKEQREQFAHYSFLWRAARANCSRRFLKSSDWVKSNGSNLLLGIKLWKGSEKHKKYEFFQANCKFLRAICSNHEQIALVTL